MDIDKFVISKILKLMEAQGLNQAGLAKKAKIDAVNLNRLFRGRRSITKSEILPDIAKALGVNVNELKSIEENSHSVQKSPSKAEQILTIQAHLLTMSEIDLDRIIRLVEKDSHYHILSSDEINEQKLALEQVTKLKKILTPERYQILLNARPVDARFGIDYATGKWIDPEEPSTRNQTGHESPETALPPRGQARKK